jgi:hypothetical protein
LPCRRWKVTWIDSAYDLIPKEDATWTPIAAERRGLVNLTRVFGKSDARRVAWLKANLKTAAAQTRRLALGFSDEVWMLLNRKLLYEDKNWFLHPIRKAPEGRCSIVNTSFVARLDSLAGVAVDGPSVR